MKPRILFIDEGNGSLGFMASLIARSAAKTDVEILSAGAADDAPDPGLIPLLKSAGVDPGSRIPGAKTNYLNVMADVVIAVSSMDPVALSKIAGLPVVVCWGLENPFLSGKVSVESLQKLRVLLQSLINDFFARGYLAAFTSMRCYENIVMDNIQEGIIAHDADRRIFFFNSEAERITGYKREEVLNRDCHTVFPGKFCGGNCLFCNGKPAGLTTPIKKEICISAKDGEKKTVVMLVSPMKDTTGAMSGILASVRDVTKERSLARRLEQKVSFEGMIGRDSKMLEIFDLIRDLADINVPVLIHGESGTGKELVAAAIHNQGLRKPKLFVPVNCGALPEALLESELFGHVKGAFTGAIRDKKGRFELADGGTIFLDEIGDISPVMQVKLLRVLQEGTFERVGGEKTTKVDVRIISATNRDLSKEIAAGRFREDLFYRLSVVPVRLPPLRERKTDIPDIVNAFLLRIREEMGKADLRLSAEAMDLLLAYDWPGNIRELQNWIQFAIIKCRGIELLPVHFPPASRMYTGAASGAEPANNGSLVYRRKKRVLTSDSVHAAIEAEGGNKLAAAMRLGVSRATLYRFLEDAKIASN